MRYWMVRYTTGGIAFLYGSQDAAMRFRDSSDTTFGANSCEIVSMSDQSAAELGLHRDRFVVTLDQFEPEAL